LTQQNSRKQIEGNFNIMMFPEPIPYKEAFPAGAKVRVADRQFLELFLKEWKYHHKLTHDHLQYADHESIVKGVAFYHGGDPVYTLEDVPGLWLEQCLRHG
jgi:hypothetical protein